MSKNLVFNKVPIVIKKNSSFTIKQHVFRDTIIYDSKEINFFKEKYQRVTLFNRQNILNNSCRLIAKIGTPNGEILEKTSDDIVKIIGQDQFEVLFMALCSIINQEIRIRGLISILTTNKAEKSVQNDVSIKKVDAWSQTDETRLSKVNVSRKRRMRRQLAPYVVQDFKVPEKIKKVVVDITTFNPDESISNSSNELKEMPDLGYLHDDDSNSTSISSAPSISGLLKPEFYTEVLTNPMEVIKKTVDEHTNKQSDIKVENLENSKNLFNETYDKLTNLENRLTIESIQNNFNLILPDNTSIMLPKKPEDHFHIATEENLKGLDGNSRKKLIEIQRIIDLKFCLTPVDDEGNLPIHMAVLNEDIHLLKRQCFILNLKETSVDIEANGLTPLKLSLFKQSTSATTLLLTFGADPLSLDNTHSTYFHTAAELDTEHLTVLLQYCNHNARSLISENEDLQLPRWEEKSDDELSSHLMDHICSLCDSKGYTPLMLATNLGLYNNVRALLTHSPPSVNTVNPTTGNTALYLAVVASCNDVARAERNNKSKLVDNFRKTIEILLDYGADPAIDNYSGSNVSVLLNDYPCPELSTLIANKGPASKYNTIGNYNSLMFIKDGDVTKAKVPSDINKNTIKLKNFRKIKDKPVILESIVLSKNDSDPESKIETKTETNSNANKVENQSLIDQTKSQTDCSKSHDDLNLDQADSIKIYSKIETDSTKSKINYKLIELKKQASPRNIIVDKPNKIIIKPVKLIDIDKSNSSVKRIESSIEKIDSSIEKSDYSIEKIDSSKNSINKIDPTVIIESMSKLKAKNFQNSKYPNITFAEFNSITKSNAVPSDINFLYTPPVCNINNNRFIKLNRTVSIPKEINSISRSIIRQCSSGRKSIAVTKAKPKVYIKKSIVSTETSIKKEIDDDNEIEANLKSSKRKLSDSE